MLNLVERLALSKAYAIGFGLTYWQFINSPRRPTFACRQVLLISADFIPK